MANGIESFWNTLFPDSGASESDGGVWAAGSSAPAPPPPPQTTTPSNGGNGGGIFSGVREALSGLKGLFGGGDGAAPGGGVWGGAAQAGAGALVVPEQVVCEFVSGVAYQCPPDWRTKDPVLEAMTQNTLAGSLVRLTGGYNPSTRRWSRTRKSFQISGDAELGWAHAATVGKSWMGRDVIRAIAREQPQLSAAAWGSALAQTLATEAGSNEVIDLFLKKSTLPSDPRAMALIRGWNVISQTVPGQRIYAREWWRSKVAPQYKAMQRLGWQDRMTLAALVRLRNSGRQAMILNKSSQGEKAAVQAGLDEYVAQKKSRANDVERIRTWPEFQGVLGAVPKWTDLGFQGATGITPVRRAVAPFTLPPVPGATVTPPGGVTRNGGIMERARLPVYVAGAATIAVLVGGVWVAYKLVKG